MRALSLAIFLLFQSYSPLYAQQATQGSNSANKFLALLPGQGGDTNFLLFDKSQIQTQMLSIEDERRKSDFKFLQGALDEFHQEFVSFVEESIFTNPTFKTDPITGTKSVETYGGLAGISAYTSQSGKTISAEEFTYAINDYLVGLQRLKSRIQSIVAIAEDGSLPSQTRAGLDGTKTDEIPSYGQVNFKSIQEWYLGDGEKNLGRIGELEEFVRNLPHNIMTLDGIPHVIVKNSGQGLSVPESLWSFTLEDYQSWREEVVELRKWDPEHQLPTIDNFTMFTKDLVFQFIATYGSEDKYRTRTGETFELRNEAWQEIVKVFWLRSYIRAVYEVPLGTFGIEWDRKYFGMDFFTASSKINIVEEPVHTLQELIEFRRNFKDALVTMNSRAKDVLDGEHSSFMSQANSFMNWIGGNKPLAQASEMMLILLANDLYEEQLILSPRLDDEGMNSMLLHYEQTWYLDPDNRETAYNLEDTYFPEEGDSPLLSGVFSEESLPGQIQAITAILDVKALELQKADELLKNIRLANNVKKSKASQRQKGNRGRLRDRRK